MFYIENTRNINNSWPRHFRVQYLNYSSFYNVYKTTTCNKNNHDGKHVNVQIVRALANLFAASAHTSN